MIHTGGICSRVCVAGFFVACATPPAALAQTWMDAYRAGDYEKAAYLLHVIVTVDANGPSLSDDPEPFHHLALLYARGLGVPRDPLAACTLAVMEYEALDRAIARTVKDLASAERHKVKVNESQSFVNEHCRTLSNEHQGAALGAIGCYAFGMPERMLIAAGRPVWIGRRGVRLAEDEKWGSDLGCLLLFASVRVTSVEPPTDAARGVKARHFVELFSWTVGKPSNGAPQYLLEWRAHEVLEKSVVPHEPQVLETATIWPRSAAPPGVEERVSLQMISSGQVRWSIEGVSPKRGWLMIPDTKE